MTILDYLRHGEPIGGKKYRGNKVDDPLSKIGWEQMKNAVANLGNWDQIVSSPLLRCSEFAHWLSKEKQIPIKIIEGLQEVGFGDWEGKTKREVIEESPEEYQKFYLNPLLHRPRNAEPLEKFGDRASEVLKEITQNYIGQRVLIVAHAGIIRAALGNVMNIPLDNWYKVTVDNGSISRFIYDDKKMRVEFFNWTNRINKN